VLSLNPDLPQPHRFLGITDLEKEMYKEAIAEHQQAVTVTKGSSTDLSFLGGAYAAAGDNIQAKKTLQELERRSAEEQHALAHARFYVHLKMGDLDEALEWLERSINEQEGLAGWVYVELYCDPLRDDPRFQDLLRRMSFPP
jgi:tetratricopeptide (TPR) repeat protein